MRLMFGREGLTARAHFGYRACRLALFALQPLAFAVYRLHTLDQHVHRALTLLQRARGFDHRVAQVLRLRVGLCLCAVKRVSCGARRIQIGLRLCDCIFALGGDGILLFDALLSRVVSHYELRCVQRAEFVHVPYICARLFGLLAQRAYLTFGFGDYVFHARQVLIGIFDFALGLGLARLVLGYTGGFLEYGAAVFAARGQNFVYPALPYQRIALLAYAGVAEKVDYVLQAARAFV